MLSAERVKPTALQRLRVTMIAALLFIISVPELVNVLCKAGIVGSFPALNASEVKGAPHQ